MLYLLLGLICPLLLLLFGKKFKKTLEKLNSNILFLATYLTFVIIMGYIFARGLSYAIYPIAAVFLFFITYYLFDYYQKGKNAKSASHLTKMTRQQALDILGLKQDSDRETIQKAHRELLKKLHPDCGGSNYLTAIINDAKNFLLSG